MSEPIWTLGFVQRDGNMHDLVSYSSLESALNHLREKRHDSNPYSIHWYLYDLNDPERGYFEPGDEAA